MTSPLDCLYDEGLSAPRHQGRPSRGARATRPPRRRGARWRKHQDVPPFSMLAPFPLWHRPARGFSRRAKVDTLRWPEGCPGAFVYPLGGSDTGHGGWVKSARGQKHQDAPPLFHARRIPVAASPGLDSNTRCKLERPPSPNFQISRFQEFMLELDSCGGAGSNGRDGVTMPLPTFMR